LLNNVRDCFLLTVSHDVNAANTFDLTNLLNQFDANFLAFLLLILGTRQTLRKPQARNPGFIVMGEGGIARFFTRTSWITCISPAPPLRLHFWRTRF
jgi:hypothetical protein